VASPGDVHFMLRGSPSKRPGKQQIIPNARYIL
jgi:hypothetical protein